MRRIFCIFGLLFILILTLPAQEAANQSAPTEEPVAQQTDTQSIPTAISASPVPEDLARKTLRFRIAAATIYELRDIAAEYGLSADGTADELRARLFAHFGFDPIPKLKGDVSMTIEKAGNVQYFTIENGTKEIRVNGPLEIRFADSQGTIHRIAAQYLVFNRDTNEVQATGNVEYTRETKTRIDVYKGQSIAVNLDESSGVFVDGSFNMEPTGTESRTLIVHFGTLISRSDEVVSLANGSLTACDAINPHYLLRAKKIWLFGSGDWAVVNATLYVGSLPVLWLPFFYYPSKASMFHPVVGFRSRQGGFVQTTTYIAGTQGAEARQSSAFSLQQGAAGSFGTYVSRTQMGTEQNNSSSLAVLVDAYSSLGAFAGLRGKSATRSPVNLNWLVGTGLSRSVFLESTGYYSPYDWAGNYKSVWNDWKFGSIALPVRLVTSFEASSRQNTSGLSWKVSLPFYSDPFIDQDFLDRKESYDFFSIFGGASSTVSERTSFVEKASLSWSWRSKDTQRPLTFNVSNLSSSLSWKSKYASTSGMTAAQLRLNAVNPQRHFFYPENARVADTTFSASGVIARSNAASLGWTTSNAMYVEDRFYSLAWQQPQDIDFKSWYWLLGSRNNASLNARLSVEKAALDFQFSSGLSGQVQYRPYLYDERISPTTVHPFKLADYGYNTASWDAGTSIIWSPLRNIDMLSASKLQYSLSGKIAMVSYEGLDGSGVNANPIYTLNWLSWDDTMIRDHSILAELAAKIGSTSERLSFKIALPPLLENYTFSLSSAAGIVSFGAAYILSRQSSLADLTSTSLAGNISLQPLKQLRFGANAAWDFDANAPLSVSADITAWSFNTRFTAQKANGYIFKNGSWIQDGTLYFRPSAVSLAWKPVLRMKPPQEISDKLVWYFEFGSAFSLSQNLIQYTNAIFGSDFRISLKNSQGLSLDLSISSINKSFWRYYAGLLPVVGDLDPKMYERNFFNDLLDSLSIWDSARLQRTLFKLQKLSLTLAVDAHDWDFAGSISAGPTLMTPDTGRPYYKMDVSFSIAVTWKDISAIKSSINYSGGAFSE